MSLGADWIFFRKFHISNYVVYKDDVRNAFPAYNIKNKLFYAITYDSYIINFITFDNLKNAFNLSDEDLLMIRLKI